MADKSNTLNRFTVVHKNIANTYCFTFFFLVEEGLYNIKLTQYTRIHIYI